MSTSRREFKVYQCSSVILTAILTKIVFILLKEINVSKQTPEETRNAGPFIVHHESEIETLSMENSASCLLAEMIEGNKVTNRETNLKIRNVRAMQHKFLVSRKGKYSFLVLVAAVSSINAVIKEVGISLSVF